MKLPTRTQQFITNGAHEGQRNEELFLAAQQLRDAGIDEFSAIDKLYPSAVASGLKEREIEAAVKSAYRRSPRQRGMAGAIPFWS